MSVLFTGPAAHPFRPAVAAFVYLVYTFNRFQACRFGLEGTLIDPTSHQPVPLAQELIDMLATVMPYAAQRGAGSTRMIARES